MALKLPEIIKEGDFYRSFDKPNGRWIRHYFVTTAKCVLVNSTTTLDTWIANINSAIQGIISQTDSEATDTVPSSKLFHDTVATMQSNFRAGCNTIADAITSNGGTASASSTPAEMAAAIDGIRSPNRGTLSASIGNADHTNNSYTVQSGFYTGGTVTLNDSNLKAENIAKNVKIFGITGTFDNGSANVKGNATAAHVLATTGANGTGDAIKFSSATAGSDVQGTIVNNGTTTNQSLSIGGSFTVKAGYHAAQFTVSAPTFSLGTQSNVVAGALLSGYRAWNSSGTAVDGNIISRTGTTKTLSMGAYQDVSAGYYASGFRISAPTLTLDSGKTICPASYMLTGYQAFNTSGGKITGTMANRGAKNYTIGSSSAHNVSSVTIEQGYHSGSGKVTIGDSNLAAGNIKSGVQICGVTGTYTVSSTKNFKVTIPTFSSSTSQTAGGYGGGADAWGQIYIKVTNTNGTLTMKVLDNTLGDTGFESWVKCNAKYMQYSDVVTEKYETLGGNYISIADA